MSNDLLAGYEYLWDGSKPGWVLLRSPELASGYCVIHKTDQVLMHIDDERLALLLCERMRASGCEVLEEMPESWRQRRDVIPKPLN